MLPPAVIAFPSRPQVSKLTTVLLRACRTAAGCSSWDPLVAGVAVGKLVELEELDPMVLSSFKEPVVVLLRSASGDEEVAAAGANLKGVVLTQDLPHLSHLGEWAWGSGKPGCLSWWAPGGDLCSISCRGVWHPHSCCWVCG